jgi:hypothetical protein
MNQCERSALQVRLIGYQISVTVESCATADLENSFESTACCRFWLLLLFVNVFPASMHIWARYICVSQLKGGKYGRHFSSTKNIAQGFANNVSTTCRLDRRYYHPSDHSLRSAFNIGKIVAVVATNLCITIRIVFSSQTECRSP